MKKILIPLIIIFAACATEEEITKSGPLFEDSRTLNTPTKERPDKNAVACITNKTWKYSWQGYNVTSGSTGNTTYTYFPYTTTNPDDFSATIGTYPTVLTVRLKNTGQTPIRFSFDNINWTSLFMNQYSDFTISVPQILCPTTLPAMTFTKKVYYKSTGCPPGATQYAILMSLISASNGAQLYYSPTGGITVGYGWGSPSQCTFTP